MTTKPVLNQDPIQIVTWRVLPSGEVEALMRLSERDMTLVEDRGARYSIEPNPPRYLAQIQEGNSFAIEAMQGLLDGGPVGEAAEMGKDIERLVTARLDVTPEQARALYETQPPQPQRCIATWVFGDADVRRCNKPDRHRGEHDYVKEDRPWWKDGTGAVETIEGNTTGGTQVGIVTGGDVEPEPTVCGASTIFWPDMEACEATCMLPIDHPGTTHEDEILGEWDEDALSTRLPDERL